MKNKKMVATIASLCLVVVAVVAAVVGVLAAVTQHTQTSISVTYTALDVHAKVTLSSNGPMQRTGDASGHRSLSTSTSGNTTTLSYDTTSTNAALFLPTSTTAAPASYATLSAESYAFGWDDGAGANGATFHDKAIYQFKFENLSATKALKVEFVDNSSKTNVVTKFFQVNDVARNIDDISVTRNTEGLSATGAVATYTLASDTALTGSGDDSNEYSMANIEPGDISYLYLIVVLNEGQRDGNLSIDATDNTLHFTLTAVAKA